MSGLIDRSTGRGVALLTVLFLVGLVGLAGCSGASATRRAPGTRSTSSPGALSSELSGPQPLPSSADAIRPTSVSIPAIGVTSTLQLLHLNSAGALVPPSDFVHAGWYTGGPVPGDPGPAVVAGHVDSFRGPAIFFRLKELTSGDVVSIARSDGSTVRFAVTGVHRYPKNKFPTATVYGPVPDPELRLITCGGSFNRAKRSYRDNIVVSARRL